MDHGPDRIVLVTGASKGIGAQVAQRLAGRGTHVIVHYREDSDRANAVADAVRAAGGYASTLGADICEDADATAMIDHIATQFGRLDALVLNASGSTHLGADLRHAMRLNRDAQRHLARLALPLMPHGGRIVYATSHQAHFYPDKAVPKGYAAVAASMRAGETALYAIRSELARVGVHLTVVSGDMADPGLADSIATATNAKHPSGMVFVGGAHYLMTA
ncbi:SDR family NAD(P)-dependent oxidoreductase [Mycobacterium sp. PS03-16]|uniref:SDR family oxidoreductase n=1 Tax=Mycobacterium sp. PS03-16 TaxID=2559611 RepID=UPI00107341F5|nr:SDR family oxidoreductase [Mycobacterium sp. PS03-16]TFV56112.1 SDR family NAD(P)-dependent oxidoreductase [Mycobacterium sp. PS03-16]